MRTAFWIGLGVLFLVWVMYLTVAGAGNKKQVYLFWTLCATLACGLLVAMGIDYLLFIGTSSAESFRKHMFESTFLNTSNVVRAVAWVAVGMLFALVWTQGLKLKNILKQYVPASDLLEDITYRMIAIGWPLDCRYHNGRGLGQ